MFAKVSVFYFIAFFFALLSLVSAAPMPISAPALAADAVVPPLSVIEHLSRDSSISDVSVSGEATPEVPRLEAEPDVDVEARICRYGCD